MSNKTYTWYQLWLHDHDNLESFNIQSSDKVSDLEYIQDGLTKMFRNNGSYSIQVTKQELEQIEGE